MRVYVCHRDSYHAESFAVSEWRGQEASWLESDPLHRFSQRLSDLKRSMWEFFIMQARSGQTVVGYGAAAKATTVLGFCGIGPEMLPWIADTTPGKQGHLLGGIRIPIVSPQRLSEEKPDSIYVIPNNWWDEIRPKLREECPWGPTLVRQVGTEMVVDDG